LSGFISRCMNSNMVILTPRIESGRVWFFQWLSLLSGCTRLCGSVWHQCEYIALTLATPWVRHLW
jgi:hypothetical protein